MNKSLGIFLNKLCISSAVSTLIKFDKFEEVDKFVGPEISETLAPFFTNSSAIQIALNTR